MASVEKRTRNGQVSWLARWRDPAGRQRKRSFAKKSDAERYLAGVRSSVLRGDYVDPAAGRVTVGEWATTWLAGRAGLKPSTRASYDSLLRTRVLPRWAEVPLSSVTYGEVAGWVAGMTAGGLSASRTRQAYHVLTSMLDDAVKDSRLARNPAAGVDLPRLRQVEKRFLSHDELHRLADAAGQYRLLVLVLGYTGLRWSEVAALRVRDVDVLRGRLDVQRAVVEVNGALVVGSPKSHAARSVPVPRFLRDDLGAACEGKGRDGLVFCSPRGEVLRVGNVRRRGFDRATVEAGLDGLTPHELRHTAASLAIAAGASVKAVQRMLGHASATLTLDRYGHLFGDELDSVADRLDAAVAQRLVPPTCPEPPVRDLAEHRVGR